MFQTDRYLTDEVNLVAKCAMNTEMSMILGEEVTAERLRRSAKKRRKNTAKVDNKKKLEKYLSLHYWHIVSRNIEGYASCLAALRVCAEHVLESYAMSARSETHLPQHALINCRERPLALALTTMSGFSHRGSAPGGS